MADRWIGKPLDLLWNLDVALLSFVIPVFVLMLSGATWRWQELEVGAAAISGALLAGIFAQWLSRPAAPRRLAYMNALSGVLLFTIALLFMLDGNILFLAIALEATALHLLAEKLQFRSLQWIGHAVFTIIGFVLAGRLLGTAVGSPIFNWNALTDIAVLSLACGVTFLPSFTGKHVYDVANHFLFLGWIVRELLPLADGQALISAAWGIYGVTMLVLALLLKKRFVNVLAMTTLAILVGKLLLVDLSVVDAVWRILLFFVFGGAFLVLSYFYRTMWQQPQTPSGSHV